MFGVFSKYLFFLPYVLAGFGWGIVMTPLAGLLAKKFKFVDVPPSMRQISDGKRERKWHKKLTPRLGGIVLLTPLLLSPFLFGRPPWIVAFTIALTILIVLGVCDDRFEISGKWQMLILFFASLIAVIGGVVITNVQNPFDSLLKLEIWPIDINLFGRSNTVYIVAAMVSIFWLMTVSNAINWIDNIGGVAVSITMIALLSVFLVAVRSWDVPQAGMAALLLGTLLGFLPFNIIPEKIFIGGTALALGFTVGALSIMEKTKLSVWFIVLGLPLIDLITVVFTRIKRVRPKSLKDFIGIFGISGKEHLAFRLAEVGLTRRQVWVVEFVISLAFGFIGLAASGLLLTISIFGICGIMMVIYLLITHFKKKVELSEKQEKEATPEERFAY